MSAAVPFFHSTWPKGSSDVFFPLSTVIKGSVQRNTAQIYFQGRIKDHAVESADGDHNPKFRWIIN